MSLEYHLDPEREARVRETAQKQGLEPSVVLDELIDRFLPALIHDAGKENSFQEGIRRMMSRTPEQIAAAQAQAIKRYRPERELGDGQTLFDVMGGQWPGDETDEEIERALEKLS